MPSLRKDLRSDLEKTILKARQVAEEGAREALTALAVGEPKPFAHLTADVKALRNKLRARGRQAGDVLDERTDRQAIDHLVVLIAYEHWHRMLFARFLAENGFLLEPEHQVPVSLADVDELARDDGGDVWELAGRFAQRMLPEVFRANDPALAVTLARESRVRLEKLVADLPAEVFKADDSLGWTYQFWQTQRKDEINTSGVKIGADELSPVTQLFTEDYMVEFLFHNTLGAWHAGKVSQASSLHAGTEVDVRKTVSLPPKDGMPGIDWTYLRFVQDEKTKAWSPAAGTFNGWPKEAKFIRFLDPCMGSGHFVVFALPLIARMRMEEEGLSAAVAIHATLRDNLFNLELDERCTQIAAFNVALTAWKLGSYQVLPPLHFACSGLAPHTSEKEWVALAGDNDRLQRGMARLYGLFNYAPVLGSLINPREGGNLIEADFHELQPLLAQALKNEKSRDDDRTELGVVAEGLAKAAEILAGHYTLVATNVPYLGRGKQEQILKKYCEVAHTEAKADLATCFVERCIAFCSRSGTAALVTPQNWWFIRTYSPLRLTLLTEQTFCIAATLGEEAWQSFGNRGPVAGLIVINREAPSVDNCFPGINPLARSTIPEKINELVFGVMASLNQGDQLNSPDHKISVFAPPKGTLLCAFARSYQGIKTGDDERFCRGFWESPCIDKRWRPFQSSPSTDRLFGGLELLLYWGDEGAGLARKQGLAAWRHRGVLISQMRSLSATLYYGEPFAGIVSPLVVEKDSDIPAVWAYCTSAEYKESVRKADSRVSISNGNLINVAFDAPRWRKVAAARYPDGLPKPHSDDPTQWLFNGHPRGADHPLQVSAARLLRYRWPRQTGSSFVDCPSMGPDGLETHVDEDGIVCLQPLRGERAAADRLRSLLAEALGAYDEHALIAATDGTAETLEEWLRDEFFEQHCSIFQCRPFIWHIWDGLSDGFHAFVNYHLLAAPDGAGHRLLENLTFSYLGDWIKKQQDDIAHKKPGAEDRLIAAQSLQAELKAILAGEPPYDIFVRWKPLHQQAIGWEPDINDGVRLNIRPFMLAKDVGRKGAGILRAKPNIKWDKDRGTEPSRPRGQFPWFWGWDETTVDFSGGTAFDGCRWNDCHYTLETKRIARERHNPRTAS